MREASGGRRSTSLSSPSARGCGASTAPASASSTTPATSSRSLLSVDNSFVSLLLAASAVPKALQQRVLLIGVVGALLLRGVFIALGAQMLEPSTGRSCSSAWFSSSPASPAARRRAGRGLRDRHLADALSAPAAAVMPVKDKYHGTSMTVRDGSRRALTPLALVTVAILATDIVFAVDSVPAVYGITGDPYLVFATNASAPPGCARSTSSCWSGARCPGWCTSATASPRFSASSASLVLHWAHGIWPATPEVPTLACSASSSRSWRSSSAPFYATSGAKATPQDVEEDRRSGRGGRSRRAVRQRPQPVPEPARGPGSRRVGSTSPGRGDSTATDSGMPPAQVSGRIPRGAWFRPRGRPCAREQHSSMRP